MTLDYKTIKINKIVQILVIYLHSYIQLCMHINTHIILSKYKDFFSLQIPNSEFKQCLTIAMFPSP